MSKTSNDLNSLQSRCVTTRLARPRDGIVLLVAHVAVAVGAVDEDLGVALSHGVVKQPALNQTQEAPTIHIA